MFLYDARSLLLKSLATVVSKEQGARIRNAIYEIERAIEEQCKPRVPEACPHLPHSFTFVCAMCGDTVYKQEAK